MKLKLSPWGIDPYLLVSTTIDTVRLRLDTILHIIVWNKMFTFGSGLEEIDWVFLYSGANQFFGKTRLGEMYLWLLEETDRSVGLRSQSFLLVRVLNHTESFLSVEGFEGVKDSWMHIPFSTCYGCWVMHASDAQYSELFVLLIHNLRVS